MKKLISVLIVSVMLLQMNLPVISFAVNEEKKDVETEIEQNKEQEKVQEEKSDKQDKKEKSIEEKEDSIEEETKGQEKKEESKILQSINLDITPEITETVKSNGDKTTIIPLDEKIKNYLLSNSYDLNDDGEFSIEELSNVYRIDIYCDDEDIDLTGIEYMTNLSEAIFWAATEGTNYEELAKVPNLKTLKLGGYLGDISFLNKLDDLENLEINMWGGSNPFDTLPILSNLKSITIGCNNGADTNKLGQFTNLEKMRLQIYSENSIDLNPLSQLSKLNELWLENCNLSNLSALISIKTLKTLFLNPNYNNLQIDIASLVQMDNIENLTICNPSKDINWINNMTSLKSLSFEFYDNKEVTPELLQAIRNLNVKNVNISGTVTYDLGEIEPDKIVNVKFEDIPILKEMMDSESNLYYEAMEYNIWEYENFTFVFDDNGKKVIEIVPKEDKRRTEYIHFYNGVTIQLKWSFPKDNQNLVIGDKIKQELIKKGADLNKDGELTKAEINSIYDSSLYLYFNSDEEPDLTGIEYFENLRYLSISAHKNIDFTPLKLLKNLESISISGIFDDISFLDEINSIRQLSISPDWFNSSNIDLSVINNLENLERLELYNITEDEWNTLNKMDKLINLKRLDISFKGGNQIFDSSKIVDLSNLEELRLNNVNTENLAGLENLSKLKKLVIQPYSTDGKIKLDTNTLGKLNNLEELDITLTDDLDWINELTNLKQVTFRGRSYGYDEENELSDEMVNKIKNINAKVKINGSFTYTLGNVEIGNEIDFNLNDYPIIKEFNDPNSNLYAPNLQIQFNHYGVEEADQVNEYTYNQETKNLHIKVKEFGRDSAYMYANSNYESYIYVNFVWFGTVKGDDKKEITFKDDNLKQALLDNYDIDNDKKITENDLINIQRLDLDNKGIKDITGLENLINADSIILTNNQIKDASSLIELSKKENIYIDLENNELENVTHLQGANYYNINFSKNYIDFSENSTNTEIIKDYLTEYFRSKYPEYKQNAEKYGYPVIKSEEEFINDNIEDYFNWYTIDQKEKQFKMGDINADGKINARDAKMALQHFTGKIKLTDDQKSRADVNEDGKINARDAKLILQFFTGKIKAFK